MNHPPEICDECRATLGDSWIADVWLYCRHSQVMAKRRRLNDAWTLKRNVSPGEAQKHIDAALALAKEHFEARGISLDEGLRFIQAFGERADSNISPRSFP